MQRQHGLFMTKLVNIAHLTDLHFTRRDGYNQSVVIDALTTDLKCLADRRLAPDVIVFSGDLVQDPDEADVYLRLLDDVILPVLTAANCAESRLIVTPGNHDVHRSALEPQRAYFSRIANPDYEPPRCPEWVRPVLPA